MISMLWHEASNKSWIAPFINHLWQSTGVAVVAWLLALAIRNNRAQVRYWVWMAASAKFLLPFSLLIGVGESARSWLRTSPAIQPAFTTVMEQITRPIPQAQFLRYQTPAPAVHQTDWLSLALVAIWACGFWVIALRWIRAWWSVRAAVRAASPFSLAEGVPVLSTATRIEPGIFGIFRPVLLLPGEIVARLTPAQLDAVLAHEMCHVRRRDNLTFAIHMAVEALFWFHPLVWWIGARLIDERERACDEEVVQAGGEAQVYAEGILNVCKFYAESPLACVSGVTGADLKKRIARIMSDHVSMPLTLGKKLLLIAVPSVTFLIAILPSIGVDAQLLHPQNGTAPAFEVASVKPDHTAGDVFSFRLQPGRFVADGAPLDRLIRFAYDVKSDRQIADMPGWAGSERFDIDAKISDPEIEAIKKLSPDEGFQQYRLMVQSLLADRFQMRVQTETRALPVYALVVAKNGSRVTPSATSSDSQKLTLPRLVFTAAGDLKATCVSMAFFAGWLSGKPDTGDRVVIDATGLKGAYDFALRWNPVASGAALAGANANQPPADAPPANDDKPSLLTAIQEQLGLKLEPRTAPVEVLVIDHIEQPSPN